MRGLLFITLGAIAGILTHGQMRPSIPKRELGFVHGNGKANALVKLACFIDLTCQGSRDAYSTLLKLDKKYKGSELQLKFHLYSLPHHRHSHTISKAAHHLNYYTNPKGAKLFDWFQVVYDNLDYLTTAATFNKTDAEVLDFLASLAYNVTEIPSDEFKAGVADVYCDAATKLEWKYGATRGVYDVPLCTMNDVFVDATYVWTVKQWEDIINPLLSS